MKLKTFIAEVLSEIEYRSNEGIVDLKKESHITILSEILDELGLSEMKSELISNLTEEKDFKNSVLNREISYNDESGETKKNKVGNLLRLKDDHPGKISAERALPSDPDEVQKVMDELGNENQPKRKDDVKDTNPTSTEDGEESVPEPETGTAFKDSQSDSYLDSLPEGDPANESGSESESESYLDSLPDGDPAKLDNKE